MQKAIQLSEVNAPFIVGTRPIPKPNAGQLLIKIHAAALNPFDMVMQKYGAMVYAWPNVCGWDGSGVVEAVGEGVDRFNKGDKV